MTIVTALFTLHMAVLFIIFFAIGALINCVIRITKNDNGYTSIENGFLKNGVAGESATNDPASYQQLNGNGMHKTALDTDEEIWDVSEVKRTHSRGRAGVATTVAR